jgi:hypothetical protein
MPEEYRRCLHCWTEIQEGRGERSNFCNGKCRTQFRTGMTEERYLYWCETNRLIPIRGNISPGQQRARRRTGNVYHRICKLSEFKDKAGNLLCDVKFATENEKKLFCEERHQERYNSIKAQLRKVERRDATNKKS